MKVKVYIVTYNNDAALNRNLDSLYQSDLMDYEYEITVINNHSNFHADVDRPNLRVIHNTVRPDWSTGHLARDWNYALIDGFRNVEDPDCDIVVACQNDTVFYPNWCSYIVDLHKGGPSARQKRYHFITFGHGDNYMSWTVKGVKNIGLWDERFNSISYQEGDYFLRARQFHGEKSSINDHVHERVHNEEENKVVNTEYSQHESNKEFKATSNQKAIKSSSRVLYNKKWRCLCESCCKRGTAKGRTYKNWDHPTGNLEQHVENYLTYPYFELPFQDKLRIQRYLL